MASRVLSAKLPEELIADLSAAAADQGLSRNALVRRALEAVTTGETGPISDADLAVRDVRRRLARDRARLHALRGLAS